MHPTFRQGLIIFVISSLLLIVLFSSYSWVVTNRAKAIIEGVQPNTPNQEAEVIETPQVAPLSSPVVQQNSKEYQFSQDPSSRLVTIKKSGQSIYSFEFQPTVFAAWVDETLPLVALVTTDTGLADGAHGLYLYDGKAAKKVYQAGAAEFDNGSRSVSQIYNPDGDGSSTFSFSPDNRYLFGSVSGYESSGSFAIDLSSLEEVESALQPSASLFWSPSQKCGFDFTYDYGDSQSAQLVTNDQGKLSVKVLKGFIMAQFGGMYWDGDCSGVLAVHEVDQDEYFRSTDVTRYYRFSSTQPGLTQVTDIDTSKLQMDPAPQRTMHNIFFTK